MILGWGPAELAITPTITTAWAHAIIGDDRPRPSIAWIQPTDETRKSQWTRVYCDAIEGHEGEPEDFELLPPRPWRFTSVAKRRHLLTVGRGD